MTPKHEQSTTAIEQTAATDNALIADLAANVGTAPAAERIKSLQAEVRALEHHRSMTADCMAVLLTKKDEAEADRETLRVDNQRMREALKACCLVLPVVADLGPVLNVNFRKDVNFALEGVRAALNLATSTFGAINKEANAAEDFSADQGLWTEYTNYLDKE